MEDLLAQVAECKRIISQNRRKALPFIRVIREQKRKIKDLEQAVRRAERVEKSRSGDLSKKCVVCVAEGGLARNRYSHFDECFKHASRQRCKFPGCNITRWSNDPEFCHSHSPNAARCQTDGCRQKSIRGRDHCGVHDKQWREAKKRFEDDQRSRGDRFFGYSGHGFADLSDEERAAWLSEVPSNPA